MNTRLGTVLMASMVAALSAPATAGSDAVTIDALQHQVKTLQARVEALEARHTLTSFMPNFAERFHVMHPSGERLDEVMPRWNMSERDWQDLLAYLRNE